MVELRSTYAGSSLGLVWVFLGPVLLLSLYGLVYTVIFRVRPTNMTIAQYVLYVFAGLAPFLAFSSALTSGAGSLSIHRQVLLNTVFPAELIPVRATLVAMASLPFALAVILCLAGFLVGVSWYLLLVPLVVLAQFLFTCGLVWVLSLLTLLLRDIQHVLQYVTTMLLIVTPIGYTPDMVPGPIKFLMWANPLFYFVTCYQNLLVFQRPPSTTVLGITGVMSLLCFWLGYRIFDRAKLSFYDHA